MMEQQTSAADQIKYMTVTPTLSSQTGYTVDVRVLVAQLMRFSVMNPGFISSFHDDMIVSCQKLEAKFGQDRNRLAAELAAQYQKILGRMFPDKEFNCDLSASAYDANKDDGRYTISVAIEIISRNAETITRESVLVEGIISIDPNDKNRININFVNG